MTSLTTRFDILARLFRNTKLQFNKIDRVFEPFGKLLHSFEILKIGQIVIGLNRIPVMKRI